VQLAGNPTIPREASIEWTNSYLVFKAFESLDIDRMDAERLCLVNHSPCAEGAFLIVDAVCQSNSVGLRMTYRKATMF
jgi:hypothetical protein